MTVPHFQPGDRVRPKPEWAVLVAGQPPIPRGAVKSAEPLGKGQLLRVGNGPKRYVGGMFEIDEAEPKATAGGGVGR